MTAPERIWAWAWQTMPMGQWGVNPSPSSVEYIRADLAAVPAQVRVKPLVWRGSYGCSIANGVGVEYYAFTKGWNMSIDGTTRPAESRDAAKAAAQADYEARILAAIEPQPDPRDEVIARLVEALEWYANSANWCDTPDWDGPDTCTKAAVPFRIEEEMGPMICDCGDTARAALAAAKAVQK